MNSVNFENGKKFHQSRDEMLQAKEYGDMKDIVSPDAPEDIYISPVGCYGIIRRKRERNTSINPRLEEVLLSISSQMSEEEIEKRSRIQHRGRFSDNPIKNPQSDIEEPSTEKGLPPSGETKIAQKGDSTQLSLFDFIG